MCPNVITTGQGNCALAWSYYITTQIKLQQYWAPCSIQHNVMGETGSKGFTNDSTNYIRTNKYLFFGTTFRLYVVFFTPDRFKISYKYAPYDTSNIGVGAVLGVEGCWDWGWGLVMGGDGGGVVGGGCWGWGGGNFHESSLTLESNRPIEWPSCLKLYDRLYVLPLQFIWLSGAGLINEIPLNMTLSTCSTDDLFSLNANRS